MGDLCPLGLGGLLHPLLATFRNVLLSTSLPGALVCNSTIGPQNFAIQKSFLCRNQFLKVARLQSEFCTKEFFRATNFLTKNAPKFSPKCLSLCSVGQKNPRKILSKLPTKFSKFPCENIKKKFTDKLLQERRENNSVKFAKKCL